MKAKLAKNLIGLGVATIGAAVFIPVTKYMYDSFEDTITVSECESVDEKDAKKNFIKKTVTYYAACGLVGYGLGTMIKNASKFAIKKLVK